MAPPTLLHPFARPAAESFVTIVRGEGAAVFDTAGTRYVDGLASLWYCNAGQELVDRGMIACSLDRLTLVAAAGEPKIGALFAQAELKRNFCGANSVFMAATRKRNDWIAAARDPRLRGRQ